jgi:hypothetical protein
MNTMWKQYITRTKMFHLRNAPLIPQMEISALAAMLIFITKNIENHRDATDENKATAKTASRLLAMDVAAPAINIKRPTVTAFLTAQAHRYNEQQAFMRYVIDHLPSYIFRCQDVDGGRPYEALVTEAGMLVQSVIDSGYLVPDDDSPTIKALGLLVDMVNADAQHDIDRAERIVKAAKRRLPEHQRRLKDLGLFKEAWT